jgi:hypothetical protein
MKTTLTLSFVQGANKLTLNRFEVDSVKISEIAGTLATRIINARANLIKYGVKIKGFSFNRKFNIELQINGGEIVNLNDLFEGIECKINYSAKNREELEAKSRKLADIIYDLVFLSMTGAKELVIDYSELQETNLLGA